MPSAPVAPDPPGAVEVGLDHDSDGSAELGAGMDAPHDIQGDLGEPRVFHIDADKAASGRGMFGEACGNGFSQCGESSRPICVSFTLILALSLRAAIKSSNWW